MPIDAVWKLSAENAAEYLAQCQEGASGSYRIHELGGGVSNTVLLVEGADRRMVLKQSLDKLRVEQDWRSDRRRILSEAAALQRLAPLLPEGSVPRVYFVDADNLIFAMEAAPDQAHPWKDLLLQGQILEQTAIQVGLMLGALIAGTWRNPAMAQKFSSRQAFLELRVDPYYRTAAMHHPDLQPRFESLIQEMEERRVSIVHGDWSPKNLLCWNERVMAIDFEVVHYGDPSFDAAFLLNHLVLKSIHLPAWQDRYRNAAQAFWNALSERLPRDSEWFELAMLRHLGALLLARVDGKSPAEYLKEPGRRIARSLGRNLLQSPPEFIGEVFERMAHVAN